MRGPITERKRTLSAGLHFTLLFASVIVFGMLLSRLLYFGGMSDLILRSSITLTASYLFFFIAMRFWLKQMKEDRPSLIEMANQSANAHPEKPGSLSPGFDFPVDLPGEFVPAAILAFMVLGIALWIGLEGPVILIDSAFEVALSAGLIKASRELTRGNWQGKVLRRTFFPFIFILITSTLCLHFALKSCPGKSRISELVTQCAGPNS